MATEDFSEKKDVFSKKSPKKKITLSWIVGIIVFALVAIAFVFAPALGAIAQNLFSRNSLSFGSYNNEKIEFKNGNYFYDQYRNLSSHLNGSTNPEQDSYRLWQQAFNQTVLFTALTQEAKKAGIKSTQSIINKEIIKSGAYNNKDGKFDTDIYSKASDNFKISLKNTTERDYPSSLVISDVSSIIPSSKEADFVASLAKDQKSFEYIILDKSFYPKDRILDFAKANKNLFEERDFNAYISSDEDKIDSIRLAVDNGADFKGTVLKADASANLNLGYLSFSDIKSFSNEEDAKEIFDLDINKVSKKISLGFANSFALIQPLNEKRDMDLNDDSNYKKVETYFTSNEKQLVLDYLNEYAKTLVKDKTKIDEIANEDTLKLHKTTASVYNPNSTILLPSLSSNDPDNLLSKATDDNLKNFYNLKDDTLSINEVNDSTLAIISAKSEENKSNIANFYKYYEKSFLENDFSYSILNSDKLDNKFIDTYVTHLASNNSNN